VLCDSRWKFLPLLHGESLAYRLKFDENRDECETGSHFFDHSVGYIRLSSFWGQDHDSKYAVMQICAPSDIV